MISINSPNFDQIRWRPADRPGDLVRSPIEGSLIGHGSQESWLRMEAIIHDGSPEVQELQNSKNPESTIG